jgi:hypothetical protein
MDFTDKVGRAPRGMQRITVRALERAQRQIMVDNLVSTLMK